MSISSRVSKIWSAA